MCLIIPYKKSVETCRAHHITGIAKRHKENELRNKYPTLSYIPCGVQQRLYLCGIYKQNERCIVSTPLLEIGDFVIWVKARNAFLTQGFLPSDAGKISANRMKKQVFLNFSEVPPNFFLRSKIKLQFNSGF